MTKNRLILPFAAPIYAALRPWTDTLVRVSLGAMVVPHGFEKLFLGAAVPTARNPILKIFGDPIVGAYFIGCVEFFGGLMLVLGLLTRIAAGAIAIQMFVISFFVLWPAWYWGGRGMEYALFMCLIAIAVFIRGGGRASIDALIGREF